MATLNELKFGVCTTCTAKDAEISRLKELLGKAEEHLRGARKLIDTTLPSGESLLEDVNDILRQIEEVGK